MSDFLPFRRATSSTEIRICYLCARQLQAGDLYAVLTPSRHGAQHWPQCPGSVSPTRLPISKPGQQTTLHPAQ
jgi:hypothetical protein